MAILHRHCIECGESLGTMSLAEYKEIGCKCTDCSASEIFDQQYHVIWYGGVIHDQYIQ